MKMSQDALRVLGGKAYLSSMHFERYVRDFYALMAGGGAQDTLEVDIGSSTICRVLRKEIKEKT